MNDSERLGKMAEVLENAKRLSQAIGARPGGTEEEQRASFFIEETMQKAGLQTTIEEFNCNPNYEFPRFICCAVSIVCGILCLFLQLLVLPAFIVTVVSCALYVLEVIGVAPISNLTKRGISQNVIAKYLPKGIENVDVAPIPDDMDIAEAGAEKHPRRVRRSSRPGMGDRKRKVIIVARYDSGKVCPELRQPVLGYLPLIRRIVLIGMAVIPVCLLIKMLVGPDSPADVVFNILMIIAMVTALVPIVQFVLHQTARYSEGANNNASGVAVMAEVAKRIASTNPLNKEAAIRNERIRAQEAEKVDASSVLAGAVAAVEGDVVETEEAVEVSADLEGVLDAIPSASIDLLKAQAEQAGSDTEADVTIEEVVEAAEPVSEGSLADVVMHGEEAIRRESGLPEDIDIEYDAVDTIVLDADDDVTSAEIAEEMRSASASIPVLAGTETGIAEERSASRSIRIPEERPASMDLSAMSSDIVDEIVSEGGDVVEVDASESDILAAGSAPIRASRENEAMSASEAPAEETVIAEDEVQAPRSEDLPDMYETAVVETDTRTTGATDATSVREYSFGDASASRRGSDESIADYASRIWGGGAQATTPSATVADEQVSADVQVEAAETGEIGEAVVETVAESPAENLGFTVSDEYIQELENVDGEAKTILLEDASSDMTAAAAARVQPVPAPMRSRYATPAVDWSYASTTRTETGSASSDGAMSSKYGSNVPDWFKRGVENANARKDDKADRASEVGRSRLSDALDAAHRGMTAGEAAQAPSSIQETRAAAAAASERTERPLDVISEERTAFKSMSLEPAPAYKEAERESMPAMSISFADEREQAMEEVNARRSRGGRSGVDAIFGDVPGEEPASPEADVTVDAIVEEISPAADESTSAVVERTLGDARGGTGAIVIDDEPVAAPSAEAAEEVDIEAIAEQKPVEEVAEEEAAAADRTIAFIPVAPEVAPDHTGEIAVKEGKKASVEKSAAAILEEATAKADEAEAETHGGRERVAARKKRELSLPSLTGAIRSAALAQEAPLADDADRQAGEDRKALKRKQHEQQSRLAAMLPSTDCEPSSKDSFSGMDFADSSLSGVIPKIEVKEDKKPSIVAEETVRRDAEEAFSTLDDVVEIEDDERDSLSQDLDIEDVDDSHYEESVTQTGAITGPGYVEMPKSRASRLMSIFGRKKRDEERSFSEAVGLDDDFDARKVGADRGGWESFQNESAGYDSASRRRADDDDWDDDWNGGAFSALRKVKEGIGNATEKATEKVRSRVPGRDRDAEEPAPHARRRRQPQEERYEDPEGAYIEAEDMIDERESVRSFRSASRAGGAFAEVAALARAKEEAGRGSVAGTGSVADAYAEADGVNLREDPMGRPRAASRMDAPIDGPDAYEAFFEEGETTEVHEEASPFQTEVWFVALGAELTENAGIKNFLYEHQEELGGAVIVELEALGAGRISQVDDEGELRHIHASARMKRYVMKAGMALGLHINGVKMNWRNSAAYVAAEKGVQTLHLAGYGDGKPMYLGEHDDVVDNLSEESLLENTALVLELLHTI